MDKNTIFRKSSLDRVSSPEQLNDYIKVSRPSVWLILGAVMVLLIGVCFWGVFGSLSTSRDALLLIQDGIAYCYVAPEEAESFTQGMEVSVGEIKGRIISVSTMPVEISKDFDTYALYLSGLKTGDWVLPVMVDVPLQDGAYMAKIVLEAISPISFVLN